MSREPKAKTRAGTKNEMNTQNEMNAAPPRTADSDGTEEEEQEEGEGEGETETPWDRTVVRKGAAIDENGDGVIDEEDSAQIERERRAQERRRGVRQIPYDLNEFLNNIIVVDCVNEHRNKARGIDIGPKNKLERTIMVHTHTHTHTHAHAHAHAHPLTHHIR